MIDATRLDEIEREINRSAMFHRAMNNLQSGESAIVRLDEGDARDLLATAREAIALRRLIDEHNAGCEAECAARPQGFCYRYKHSSKGRCPDCPRLGEIDVPGIKEPGAC